MIIREKKVYAIRAYYCPKCGLAWTVAKQDGDSQGIPDTKMWWEHIHSPFYQYGAWSKREGWRLLYTSKGRGNSEEVLATYRRSPLLLMDGQWYVAGQLVKKVKTSGYFGGANALGLIPTANYRRYCGGDRGSAELYELTPLETDVSDIKIRLCKACRSRAWERAITRLQLQSRRGKWLHIATQANLEIFYHSHHVMGILDYSKYHRPTAYDIVRNLEVGSHFIEVVGALRVVATHRHRPHQWAILEGHVSHIVMTHPEHGIRQAPGENGGTYHFPEGKILEGTFYFLHMPPQGGGVD